MFTYSDQTESNDQKAHAFWLLFDFGNVDFWNLGFVIRTEHVKSNKKNHRVTPWFIVEVQKWFKRWNSDANAINGCQYAQHTEQKVCKLFQKAISMYKLQWYGFYHFINYRGNGRSNVVIMATARRAEVNGRHKKKASYLHRTATTAYPCCVPTLGDFAGAGRVGLASCKYTTF